MKANEAPEKVYITECMLFATNPEITLPKNNSIEYTRTDAFIEKAVGWLEEHLYDYWRQKITDYRDFTDEFKRAMV